MLPSSLRAWCGLGSIFSRVIIRILGPMFLEEIRSTKWSSCLIPIELGRPERLLFCTFDYLLGDLFILQGSNGIGRVCKDRLFISRGLFQLDAFRTICSENLISKNLFEPCDNVFGQVSPPIVERDKDPYDLKAWIGNPADLVDCLQK